MKNENKTKAFILASFFTALTAACSIISIPLPFSPVPVNLALLAVYLAGGLLGAKYGFLSMVIYLILGAFGVPVFHNLTGGLGIIMGPTGGFIFGYIAAAFLTGFFYHRSAGPSGNKNKNTRSLVFGIVAGLLACYSLGLLWFMYLTGSNLPAALMLCVIPFIPGDIFKIIAAVVLIRKLEPFIANPY